MKQRQETLDSIRFLEYQQKLLLLNFEDVKNLFDIILLSKD